MKKITVMDALVFIVWLSPLAYLAYVYPSLPATVAVHFNIEGNADRMGSKSEVAIGVSILTVIGAGLFLLMKYLPKIDPKRNAKVAPTAFKKIGHAVVLLLSSVGIAIVYSAVAGKFTFDKLMFPALGLFFAYMGNIMHSIKPNYFAGIRTPWTLNDEGNWKTTHRLASKLWFAGGVAIIIGTFILPMKAGLVFFLSVVALMTIIPFVFSYRYFKKHKTTQ